MGRKYDIRRTSDVTLAGLLTSQAPKADWSESDFAAILGHQLGSSVVKELSLAGFDAAPLLADVPEIRTFRDLLAHPGPPVGLLEMVKQYTRRVINSPGAELPDEIARVLYFACIVAGILRQGQRITSLDTAGLRAGAKWALTHKWLDPALRGLFEQYLKAGETPATNGDGQ
jgi:hypothetical protein